MSYEYKAKMMLGAIQDAKDDYINATSEEDKEEYRFEIRQLENLKVLYEEAAKADEYEAKAKAFDEISDYWRTKDMLKLGHFVDKAIRKYVGEYESGESDE